MLRLPAAGSSPAPSVSSPAAAPPGRPPRCGIEAVATATMPHRGGCGYNHHEALGAVPVWVCPAAGSAVAAPPSLRGSAREPFFLPGNFGKREICRLLHK